MVVKNTVYIVIPDSDLTILFSIAIPNSDSTMLFDTRLLYVGPYEQ